MPANADRTPALSGPTTIRRATIADAPTLVAFQMRMAQETEGMALDEERLTAGVRGVFAQPQRGTYWVATRDDVVLGCLLTLPEWSDWRNATVLWIHSVYVVPAARGLGIYRALYTHLQQQVRDTDDLCGLRLYVDKRNPGAQRAYEALGMTAEHYHLYEWLPDG